MADEPTATRLGPGLRATLLVALLVAAVAAIVVGMWQLPQVFVDERGFVLSNGDPDLVAIQQAYNSARIPIGVVSAAILAATAAGAGVLTSRRAIALTQMSVDLNRKSIEEADDRYRTDREDSRSRDDADRRQWREEQLSRRFQDASAQIGNEKAAVRLAGVYALARLADDWVEQRQVCVDVLSAYLRIAVGTKQGEDEVRQAVQAVLKQGLEATPSNAPPWLGVRLDLSRTELRNFKLSGFCVTELSFAGAKFFGACLLDGECTGATDFSDVRIEGSLQISGVGLLGERMENISMEGAGTTSVWDFDPSPLPGGLLLKKEIAHRMRGLTVANGELRLRLGRYRGFRLPVVLDLTQAHVHSSARLDVEGAPRSPAAGEPEELRATVRLHGAELLGMVDVRRNVKRVPEQ